MQYTKHETPSVSPKCVHYWDSKFIHAPFWMDWLLFKAIAESNIPQIKKTQQCTIKKAHQILWNAFVEATCGDEKSPLWDSSGDFIRCLSDYDMAYYLLHLYIGSDINDGFTEEEAIERYKIWLKEKKNNGIYGKYKVTCDLEILPVKKPRSKRK
jgi:hypothetical protein